MKASLKSEIKKILTTRATYGLSLFFLVLVVFVSFYVEGFRHTSILTDTTGPLAAAQEKVFVAGTLTQIASIISIAGALIGLLLVANEYRYNTIVYTFSSSKSRSTVLVSKIIAVLGYVFCYSLLSTILALLLIHLGIAASGHSLPLQQIHNLNYITKSVVYSEGFALAGILFAVVIRNQIGAIVALLIFPTTIEGLLSLLLKHNSVYLPFTALQQVIQAPTIAGFAAVHPARDASTTGYLSSVHGAMVFLLYLVVGYIVGWYLFLRRDAN